MQWDGFQFLPASFTEMMVLLYSLILLVGSGKVRSNIAIGDINAGANERIEDKRKLSKNSRNRTLGLCTFEVNNTLNFF